MPISRNMNDLNESFLRIVNSLFWTKQFIYIENFQAILDKVLHALGLRVVWNQREAHTENARSLLTRNEKIEKENL